jgi:hypothetical protein
MHHRIPIGIVGLLGVALSLGILGLAADAPAFRFGGLVEARTPVYPSFGVDASLTLVAGWGDWDLSSRTDASFWPFTQSEETLGLSLVREWLTLGGERSQSIVPIGISSALLFARAVPPHWTQEAGSLRLDLGVEAEARVKGDRFRSVPLRSELWVKGMATSALVGVVLDEVHLGASLEGTLSAPNGGQVWPTATLQAGVRLGCVLLRSETAVSLTPLRFEAERVILQVAVPEFGLSAEARAVFLGAGLAPSAEIRLGYAFGERRSTTPTSDGCEGGVCPMGL